jgi:hypothetical protein
MEQRRAKVATLYVRGYTQRQISEVLETTQQNISRDLKALRTEWAKNRYDSMTDEANKRLAELGETKRQAWNAWEVSKEDGWKVATEIVTDEVTGKIVRTIKKQIPAFAYLLVVLRCIDSECKLLGLEPPQQPRTDGLASRLWDSISASVGESMVSTPDGTHAEVIAELNEVERQERQRLVEQIAFLQDRVNLTTNGTNGHNGDRRHARHTPTEP